MSGCRVYFKGLLQLEFNLIGDISLDVLKKGLEKARNRVDGDLGSVYFSDYEVTTFGNIVYLALFDVTLDTKGSEFFRPQSDESRKEKAIPDIKNIFFKNLKEFHSKGSISTREKNVG